MRQSDEWTTVKNLRWLWLRQSEHGGENERTHKFGSMNSEILVLYTQDNVAVLKPEWRVVWFHCIRVQRFSSAFCGQLKLKVTVVEVCHEATNMFSFFKKGAKRAVIERVSGAGKT